MQTVNVHEAKTHFSKLIEKVHNGEEIIVAKAGVPYVRLVPLEERMPRTPGLCTGKTGMALLVPLSEDELADWES
jgi:prevent-host-death family protein